MKPWEEYPNCLQATLASLSSKKSLQILPQVLPEHTSTRPTVSLLVEYGTILRSPLVQSKRCIGSVIKFIIRKNFNLFLI